MRALGRVSPLQSSHQLGLPQCHKFQVCWLHWRPEHLIRPAQLERWRAHQGQGRLRGGFGHMLSPRFWVAITNSPLEPWEQASGQAPPWRSFLLRLHFLQASMCCKGWPWMMDMEETPHTHPSRLCLQLIKLHLFCHLRAYWLRKEGWICPRWSKYYLKGYFSNLPDKWVLKKTLRRV